MKSLIRKMYYLKSFLNFAKYGENLVLSKGGHFVRPEEITFGSNVFINRGFHISARNLVFGSNIMIGPNVVIESDDHKFSEIGKTMFETRNERNVASIKIEDDVWIGANVTILKNVIIGEGAIVGAGSVVTKNVPPYCIAVGCPCRAIKPRFSIADLKEHLKIIRSDKDLNQVLCIWRENNII